MSQTIRSAEAADVAGVLELWREADTEPSHTDDPESLTQLVTRDPGALILAEADGRPVGSIIAAWDGWRGSIYRLAVAPHHRRQGLGRRLLLEAEKRLAQAGAVRVQAIVVETDAAATAFWQACGWERQPHRLRFVKG